METERRMPPRVELGGYFATTIRGADGLGMGFTRPAQARTVRGFILPKWQRPFVWNKAQCVRWVESAWRGLPLGTYTVNMMPGSDLDGYLIDGQQRMRALAAYFEGDFEVFGFRWGEVTDADRRDFLNARTWARYETRSDDEDYLRSYYDLMNFGGVAHEDHQRATA